MSDDGKVVPLRGVLGEPSDPQALKSGNGGGTFDGMEARLAALEEFSKEARSDLKAIRIDLAEMKGKMSGMPSTWQMIGIFAALIGLLLAGSGILFGLMRYFAG